MNRLESVARRSIVLAVVLFAGDALSPALAQCTDVDGDGAFVEPSCGGAVDCNDADAAIHPGTVEMCNGFDDDCDGLLDETCSTACPGPRRDGSDVRVSFGPGGNDGPRIAWAGDGYGVVWDDYRFSDGSSVYQEIYFSRLDVDGNPVGGEVRVTDDPSSSLFPYVTWNGTEFAVAWHDGRTGNSEIFFQRIDPDGNLVGTSVQVTNDANPARNPVLMWNGSAYGLVWQEVTTGDDRLLFLELDRAGSPVGSPLVVSDPTAQPASDQPHAAWTGSGYGVAWQDGRDGNGEIYFARLDAAGVKIGGDVRVTDDAARQDSPEIVWTGSEYGVAWNDERNGNGEIYFARLDATGARIGAEIRITNDPADSTYPTSPGLAWNGEEYAVAWRDGRDGNTEIYLARLDATGNPLGTDVRVTYEPHASNSARVVWTGTDYRVAWNDGRDGGGEIYNARVRCCDSMTDLDGDGVSECDDCDDLDDTVYPGAAETCDHVDDDCDGEVDEGFDADLDGYTVCSGDCNDADPAVTGAWEIPCNGIDEDCDGLADDAPDADEDGRDVCGTADPVNPDGLEADCGDGDAAVGPGLAEVCDGIDNDCDGQVDEGCDGTCELPAVYGGEVRVTNAPGDSGFVSLQWNGAEYALAWDDYRVEPWSQVFFNRIGRDGVPVGPDVQVTAVDDFTAYPSLAATGSGYLAAWEDYRAGDAIEIFDAVLDATGSRTTAETRVTVSLPASRVPLASWNGREFGVLWEDSRHGPRELYLGRIDRDGRKAGDEVRLTDSASESAVPSMVWNGSEYAVAWYDDRNGNGDIYFARFDETGNRIGAEVRVTNDPASSVWPTLAWTGSGYGVAWEDGRVQVPFPATQIYFARLDAVGNKIGSDVRVTTAWYPAEAPSLAWTGSEFALVWRDFRNQITQAQLYYARLDENGTRLGPETRLFASPASVMEPVVVWSGGELGIAWHDGRQGDDEVYFARLRCCEDDLDLDGFGACDDCVDRDGSTYPGATEACDGLDNNCDGAIDEGFPVPGGVAVLRFAADGSTMSWDPAVDADRYDVLRGDLLALRASGGDYTAAATQCVEDDAAGTQSSDPALPASGEGFFYLIRAQAACKDGTYDSGGSGQRGSRDGGLAGPPACS